MKTLPAYIGILGALGMAVCDIILLGLPVSGSQYDMSSFGAIGQINSHRAAIGCTCGLVFAFFICFGFWYLKTLFEPVNPKMAFWLFVSLSSMMFFGGAFHTGYYFVSAGNLPVKEHQFYLEMISYLGVPGFLAGTILFFWLAMDARFPKWFKYCNPLVLCAAVLGLFMLLPAPVGGYLKPAFINVALIAFFCISLSQYIEP